MFGHEGDREPEPRTDESFGDIRTVEMLAQVQARSRKGGSYGLRASRDGHRSIRASSLDSPNACAVVLQCIWWEPQDEANHPVFARHREAVRAFAAAMPDDDVTVQGLTYRQLWEYWESLGDPVLARRTGLLRDRYDVPLNRP